MRVQAIAVGYYADKLIRVGEIFDLRSEKHFSSRWMLKLEEGVEPPPRPALIQEPLRRRRPVMSPISESELNSRKANDFDPFSEQALRRGEEE
jgi:hypothetical protein